MIQATAILCDYSSRGNAILSRSAQLLARYLAVVRFVSADELSTFAAAALWVACKLEDDRAILTATSVGRLISDDACQKKMEVCCCTRTAHRHTHIHALTCVVCRGACVYVMAIC